jgi:hypothetical protein
MSFLGLYVALPLSGFVSLFSIRLGILLFEKLQQLRHACNGADNCQNEVTNPFASLKPTLVL